MTIPILSWISTTWWDMYDSRPWLTIAISGSSLLIVASDLLYYFIKSPTNSQIRKKVRQRQKLEDKNVKVVEFSERRRQLDMRKPTNLWNTVLFFPDDFPQDPNSPTRQLVHYFDAAKVSIHLCMYLTSHPALVNVIRKKHREGLVILVITDYDTFTAHNNYGPKQWKNMGIEVRMKATGFLMHHKFAVIDEEALITGSLNWTKQGLQHNQENVMVTTNTNVVSKYLEEFFNVWKKVQETCENC